MITGTGINIRKIFLSLLILSGVNVLLFAQGTTTGGIINTYVHVVSIGTDNVTVTDASLFNAGDTVLLIQMKGAIINVTESGSYGGYRESTGSPGAYEFLIIQSVNTGTDNVVFTTNILNSYDTGGMMQLIRVPYFSSASVTSKLTCQPWDSTSKTGGVISMIVGGTLTLNANIDAAGMGFIGGTPYIGSGICTVTDPAANDKFGYPLSWLNSGFKGEGLTIRAYLGPGDEPSVYPGYAKGKGANFTSGGGGNGRFAGGGGGAGYGAGGTGGVETNTCGAGNQGGSGVGGRQVKFTDLDGNILMGSGGGASTYLSGGTATAGGRGGGIIIIVCDTLVGNGKTITSDGSSPSGSSSGNAGAGGGGGGGTIALYQASFSVHIATSALTVSARGATGGNASNPFGEGGGGGGGFILTNALAFPSNMSRLVTQGAAGTRTGGSLGGTSGQVGQLSTSYSPLLNGFLYNSIKSSVSGNKADSVCSNMLPPKIIGTKPVGGSGTYTFIWQKSYERTFASPIVLTNDADPVNYTPKVADAVTPTDTVWFRRIVQDAGPPVITDISKAVKITVHRAINNNRIGNQDTLCFNGDSPALQQLLPDLVVPTTKYLFYTWQDSSSAGSWGTTLAGTKNYDPASLQRTTWFRRTVTSGSCVDSSARVKITVLPLITGNSILNTAPDICFGTTFENLLATNAASTPALGGGDNTFRFRWLSNINGSGWTTASGTSNQSNYNPAEQPERIPYNDYSYRRIVYSGSNDVCVDTTAAVSFRDYAAITGNDLTTPSQTICAGYSPSKMTGNAPANGNGVFTYTWQDSTNSSAQWQNITGYVDVASAEYQPPVLTVTTSYRRIVNSIPCIDVSPSVKITVQPATSDNSVYLSHIGGSSDTTICSGQTHARLAGTSITGAAYQWLSASTPPDYGPLTGATGVNYSGAPALETTTWYRRKATVGVCTDTSDAVIKVTVLPLITNNVINAADPAVCENTIPDPVEGATPAGGSGTYFYLWEQSSDEGAHWSAAIGANNLASYQPPSLSSPVMYRRNVSSGLADCCTSTSSEITIGIDPAPLGPVNAGADASIYSMDKTATLDADPPVVSGESGSWKALEPASISFVDETNSKTGVRNLSTGKNVLLWTITNGLCEISDTLNIELLKDLIPQGFSPNGDEYNNRFVIEGLDLTGSSVAELTILNSAGTRVFFTTNRDGQEWSDWDGRNDKGTELPEGTYYYLLKYTTGDNKVIRKSGFVVLKRY